MTTQDASVLIPAPAETLCLDFANTRFWRGAAAPAEGLNTPPDLLGWLTRAGGDAAGLRWQAVTASPWSPTLSFLLARVLWSAADLLAGPRRPQVRRCANPR
jgi:predicted RNA-binding Zn ribbon-like protein